MTVTSFLEIRRGVVDVLLFSSSGVHEVTRASLRLGIGTMGLKYEVQKYSSTPPRLGSIPVVRGTELFAEKYR